jgi:GNAT superfamily N-acetyltransferase
LGSYGERVPIRLDPSSPAVEDFGLDVFVVDTDVLLGDACAVLADGNRSELLRAIDAATGIAFMSEQAFQELGRMSAPSARGRGVDHEALRELIANDYLPRMPVVATPSEGDGHWVPGAADVSDPDDRPHAQVTRLISARAVYSHDKHLRRPGLAPATRRDYDQRVMHLSVMSTHREHERGVALAMGAIGGGVGTTVSWTSARLRVRSTHVWGARVLASAVGVYTVIAPAERRQRIGQRLEPSIRRIGEAARRRDLARRAIGDSRLVLPTEEHRLEARIAKYLARGFDHKF